MTHHHSRDDRPHEGEPLHGVIPTVDGFKLSVLEDATTNAVLSSSRPHILRAAEGLGDGMTLAAARTISLAKKTVDSNLQRIVGRYAMVAALGDSHDVPEGLRSDLTATAYRASSIWILTVAMALLVDRVEDRMMESIDRLLFDLSKHHGDAQQYLFLKKSENAALVNDVRENCLTAISEACDQFEPGSSITRPHDFIRVCQVFENTARSLGILNIS